MVAGENCDGHILITKGPILLIKGPIPHYRGLKNFEQSCTYTERLFCD